MVSDGEFTSSKLELDAVYTRDDLRDLFGITDATLNTEVLDRKDTRPFGFSSRRKKPLTALNIEIVWKMTRFIGKGRRRVAQMR